MKKQTIAWIGCALILLSGCAAPEAQIQTPNLPAAAYISGAREAEASDSEAAVPEDVKADGTPVSEETAPVLPEEPSVPEGEITLLGANMVYTGERFLYSYEISGAPEPPDIYWECGGDAGEIAQDGEFTALRKGTATLSVTDRANCLRGTLTVHVVDTAADVDFVPEVNGIPIVNKTYPLPADYDPGDLTPETLEAFTALVSAAAADGIEITFLSGYRSYGYQQTVYHNWIEKYGEEYAARASARPGHSEHQLGLAIDVNELTLEFAESPEGVWLKEHCTEFGFIIRYPRGSEPITGYIYEPWHIRYLGRELAERVTESGLTLEEYLGADSFYRDPPTAREDRAPASP